MQSRRLTRRRRSVKGEVCTIDREQPVCITDSDSGTLVSEPLYHYVIVRGDIPFGDAMAQNTHASGESAVLAIRGVPEGTRAVVLEAENESEIERYSVKLTDRGILHVVIREPDAPFNGAAMAIGIPPLPRKRIGGVLRSLPLYGTSPRKGNSHV